MPEFLFLFVVLSPIDKIARKNNKKYDENIHFHTFDIIQLSNT